MGGEGMLDSCGRCQLCRLVGIRTNTDSCYLFNTVRCFSHVRRADAKRDWPILRQLSGSTSARWFYFVYRHGKQWRSQTRRIDHGKFIWRLEQQKTGIRIYGSIRISQHVDLQYRDDPDVVASGARGN